MSSIDIVVPTLGESVSNAIIAQWLKKPGEAVSQDEPLVELETDKVTVEVNAASSGVLSEIIAAPGSEVAVGAIIGRLSSDGAVFKPVAPVAAPATVMAAPVAAAVVTAPVVDADIVLAPAVRKLVEEHGLNPALIPTSGKDGRLTKADILNYLESGQKSAPVSGPVSAPASAPVAAVSNAPRPQNVREERVRMTRLRQRIAERLKFAQNTAALLTTFNEVDMTALLAVRNEYKDVFEKKHGTKLGFMSFFVKAAIVALKEFPAVNAEIDGQDIVYKNFYDIGVAVSTPQGLVVPVLRNADDKNFSQIEAEIVDLGKKARDGKLGIDQLTGGTFSITNGGVFGSLMSTPIINPPQVAIMGMHAVKQRAVVVDGKVEARPMMYLALTYDHRIIDGREAVSFLVRIKDCIEDPRRILLDL
jgi:2-oxoglutarate dehydrogenase E2 component (dihydrolipoamide succinyltransferase)